MDLVLFRFDFAEIPADVFVDKCPLLFAKLDKRHAQAYPSFGCLAKLLLQIPGVLGLGPRIDGALLNRERAVRDHQVHVVIDGVAKALAPLASTIRIVEAEQARLRLGELLPATLAGKFFAEAQRLSAARGLKDHLARLAITDLEGVDQPLPDVRGDRNAIDQHVNRLREIDVQQRFRRGKLEDAAALIQAIEALLAKIEQAVP